MKSNKYNRNTQLWPFVDPFNFYIKPPDFILFRIRTLLTKVKETSYKKSWKNLITRGWDCLLWILSPRNVRNYTHLVTSILLPKASWHLLVIGFQEKIDTYHMLWRGRIQNRALDSLLNLLFCKAVYTDNSLTLRNLVLQSPVINWENSQVLQHVYFGLLWLYSHI